MVVHMMRARSAKPVNIRDPASIYTVLKITNGEDDEGPAPPKVSVRGVYVREEQAYAAAIHNLIFDLEDAEGASLPKMRAIAKTKTVPLRDRLKSLLSCQAEADSGRPDFVVKKTELFPEEELDMDALMDAPVMPYAYWDSSDDEQDYNPSDDEADLDDDEDDDVDDDDDEDGMEVELEAEGEAEAEGAGGSGAEVAEEEKEVVGDGDS